MKHKILTAPLFLFPKVGWIDLEKLSDSRCACCGNQFTEEEPPELTSHCHNGPVYVAYWDGNLYVSCGKCRKPVCHIAVDRKLI